MLSTKVFAVPNEFIIVAHCLMICDFQEVRHAISPADMLSDTRLRGLGFKLLQLLQLKHY